MDELKPCPFCGGKPYLANVAMVGCTYVVCTDCRAQGDDASQEGAIAAWNRRSDPRDEVIARLVEAAKALRHDIADLVANSEGVAGLHLNGDVAEWGSLLPGGAFGAWLDSLSEFDAALAAAKAVQK